MRPLVASEFMLVLDGYFCLNCEYVDFYCVIQWDLILVLLDGMISFLSLNVVFHVCYSMVVIHNKDTAVQGGTQLYIGGGIKYFIQYLLRQE
jgi:hypothetical protein